MMEKIAGGTENFFSRKFTLERKFYVRKEILSLKRNFVRKDIF